MDMSYNGRWEAIEVESPARLSRFATHGVTHEQVQCTLECK